MNLNQILRTCSKVIAITGLAAIASCATIKPAPRTTALINPAKLMYMNITSDGQLVYTQMGYDMIGNDGREDIRIRYVGIPVSEETIDMNIYDYFIDDNQDGTFQEHERHIVQPESKTALHA